MAPRNYGKRAHKEVKRAMHEHKHGQLTSEKSRKPDRSRKQAMATGLSKARKKGGKVPVKRTT